MTDVSIQSLMLDKARLEEELESERRYSKRMEELFNELVELVKELRQA